MEAKSSMILNLSLFRPFLFSSKPDHTTCPDLLLVIEAWTYKRMRFSLPKDLSQHAIHTAIVSIYLQAIRRMSGLQDAIILSCRLETSILLSRIFSHNCLPFTSEQ